MDYMTDYETRQEHRKWLVDVTAGFDLFGTFTLKQGLLRKDETIVVLTDVEIRKDLRHWINVVNRRLIGNNARRSKRDGFERVIAIEGGGDERRHVHFMAKTPDDVSQAGFIKILDKTWARLDCSRWKREIVPVQCQAAVATYIQKQGPDRIQLELSWWKRKDRE